MAKDFNRAIRVGYDIVTINGVTLKVTKFVGDYIKECEGTTVPVADSAGFAKGCLFVDTDAADGTKGLYENIGTTSASDFNLVGDVTSAEIADDAVTIDKVSIASQSVTASADGTGTGAITVSAALRNFIAVTSAAATNQVSLPGISASMLGQEFYLTVGANGYELITPASSNATINQVDSDGTNQLDVAASTTVRVMCVSATGWIAETIAATTIAVTAPDND